MVCVQRSRAGSKSWLAYHRQGQNNILVGHSGSRLAPPGLMRCHARMIAHRDPSHTSFIDARITLWWQDTSSASHYIITFPLGVLGLPFRTWALAIARLVPIPAKCAAPAQPSTRPSVKAGGFEVDHPARSTASARQPARY